MVFTVLTNDCSDPAAATPKVNAAIMPVTRLNVCNENCVNIVTVICSAC